MGAMDKSGFADTEQLTLRLVASQSSCPLTDEAHSSSAAEPRSDSSSYSTLLTQHLRNPTNSSTTRPKTALIFTKMTVGVYIPLWELNYLKITQPPNSLNKQIRHPQNMTHSLVY
jgi:hypothetical protein